ncbi:MAG: SLBB domain-containing protein [Kiritimatiellae bacterium]|nr:SLBB domain-containing protein [Kiritimatiellia bacterium]
MRRALTLSILTLLCAHFLCGCATSPEGDLARLIAELEVMDQETSSGADLPGDIEKPVSPAVDVDEAAIAAEPDVDASPAVAPDEAVASQGAGQRELTIHPNCLVQISVAEDPSLNASYSVNDFGAVELGYVGPIILMNKTEKEAAKRVQDVLTSRDFRTASVKIRILRASYGHIKVVGAVRRPGLIKIGAGDTISLNDALLRVDGLASDGRGGKVRVYRNGMLRAVPEAEGWEEFALVDEAGKPQIPNVQLRINDLAYIVPHAARRADQPLGERVVLVLGEVGRPGFQRFEGGEPCTMMHLLFRMGSLPPFANKKEIKIVRRDDQGFEQEFLVNGETILEKGRPEDDFILEDGDRIIVPARRFTLL